MTLKKSPPNKVHAAPSRLTWQALFLISFIVSVPVALVLWGIETIL